MPLALDIWAVRCYWSRRPPAISGRADLIIWRGDIRMRVDMARTGRHYRQRIIAASPRSSLSIYFWASFLLSMPCRRPAAAAIATIYFLAARNAVRDTILLDGLPDTASYWRGYVGTISYMRAASIFGAISRAKAACHIRRGRKCRLSVRADKASQFHFSTPSLIRAS